MSPDIYIHVYEDRGKFSLQILQVSNKYFKNWVNVFLNTTLSLFVPIYIYILKVLCSYWCLQFQSKVLGLVLAFSPSLIHNFFQSSHCGSEEANLTGIHDDTGSSPGCTQWVKDPALPWAVVRVADLAQILHCHSYGIGQCLQLQFDP